MKKLLFLICLLSGIYSTAQVSGVTGVTIPNLPTRIGKPRNGWLPVSYMGVTYKIDINDIASNKIDTAFIRNDSLIVVKNGVEKGQVLPSGGGGSGSTTNNYYNVGFILDTTFTWDGHSDTLAIYTHGSQINSIVVAGTDHNGSGYLNYQTIGDTTFIFYPVSPYGTLHFIFSGPSVTLQPTGLTAVPLNDTTIHLSWNNVKDESGYVIIYSYDSVSWGIKDTVAANITAYNDVGLVGNQTYYYGVAALGDGNAFRSSSFSYASATTAALATLSTPLLTVTPRGNDSMLLSWTNVPNATGYLLQYSTDTITWFDLGTLPPNVHAGVHGILSPGTTYYYRIKALGNGTSTNDSPFDYASGTTESAGLTVLSTPDLTATATSDSTINLSWPDVPNNSGYLLEYLNGNVWDIIDTLAVGVTSYEHGKLNDTTTYQYRIKAIGDSITWLSSAYGYDSATTFAAPPPPPLALPAPTIAATATGATQNTVSWNSITNATAYQVERSRNGNVWNAAPFLRFSSSTTSFIDTGLNSSTKYYYRMYAIGNGTTHLNSDYSNTVNVTTNSLTVLSTPAPTATDISSSAITISWPAVTNASSYRLQFGLDSTTWSTLADLSSGTTSYTHTGLTAGTTYYYRLRANGDNITYSNSAFSSAVNATTTSSSSQLPTPLITATGTSISSVQLSWTAIANTSNYVIEKSTNSTMWTPLATVANTITSYTDNGLNASTIYYYRMYAAGNGITWLNSNYSSDTAVTKNVILATVSKTGIISSPAGSGLNQWQLTRNMVDSMGMDFARQGYFVSESSTPGAVNSLLTAGKEVQVNISNFASDGTRNFTLNSERAAFIQNVKNVLINYLVGKKDTLIIASNEEINPTYRLLDTTTGSPTNSAYLYYYNELKPIDSLCKELGPNQFKVANGGFPGKPMWWMAWDNLRDSGLYAQANELAYQVFTPAERKNLSTWNISGPHVLAIRMEEQLMQYYKDADFDYFNIHIKEPINGIDSAHLDQNVIRYAAQAFKNMVCKPVICNELGSKSITPAITDELMQACVSAGMEYIVEYDGTGTVTDASPSGTDISLRLITDYKALNPSGKALKTRIKIIKGL